jgi:NADH-quinone oxidoreductase subunit L
VVSVLVLIPLLPFLGFLVNAFVGRRLSKAQSGAAACLAMAASFLVALVACGNLIQLPAEARAIEQNVFTWIQSGDFDVRFALRLDPLGALMVLVVTGIGLLIHVYSTGYMHDETASEYARYFSYLNLFAAFMLVLVLAANLLVMFVGWEGVGLCSYLLIGFWFQKPSAADAGKKAFIVNRVGDFGFLLGILLAFTTFHTLDFQAIADSVSRYRPDETFGVVSIIALLLFVGATGKSAQIPLHVWLPDAMEGPTPVSALIHAATMVTAGVYMIGRNAVLFSHAPQVLLLVAGIGLATAFMAGTIALVQTDIKRVLAYSTVSQLGYMFLAMGMGAFTAGIFHLFTHAFFKALLFLGSGAVIHALSGEQDLMRMGGLKRHLPVTYWSFLVATLAIAGVPGLSGFFSKDEILFRTFANGHLLLWAVALVTSFLTALYMFRLFFLAFHGEARGDAAAHGHLHDAPRSMAVPLAVLAIGSVLAGYVGVPHAIGGSNRLESFLAPSFHARAASAGEAEVTGGSDHGEAASSSAELTLMAVSTAMAFAGIGMAAFLYLKRRDLPAALAGSVPWLYNLLGKKCGWDQLYDNAVVQPVKIASRDLLWRGVDATVIDGAVNGVGIAVAAGGSVIRRAQSGSVRAYAAALLFGVVSILGYYLWR